MGELFPAGAFQLSGPYLHEQLAVFLIHGPDQTDEQNLLTLEEAVALKRLVVHETGTVGELELENLSATDYVFVQAGDIVKGGWQDRTIAV